MSYVFSEPEEYGFRDRDGHHGKFFTTHSEKANHLIIECDDKLTVVLTERVSEFTYYVTAGSGYFLLNDERHEVKSGDLVVIPAGTKFTFGGQLRMFLTTSPPWTADQETVEPRN